jgi:hypothetical protein
MDRARIHLQVGRELPEREDHILLGITAHAFITLLQDAEPHKTKFSLCRTMATLVA